MNTFSRSMEVILQRGSEQDSMATTKNEKLISVDEDMEKLEYFHTVGGDANGAAGVENSVTLPQKIKNRMKLPYPAIPLLGICPKK